MKSSRFRLAVFVVLVFIVYLVMYQWNNDATPADTTSRQVKTVHVGQNGPNGQNGQSGRKGQKWINGTKGHTLSGNTLVNVDDAPVSMHNIERTVYGGWDILYDEDKLREQVERIHTMHYTPQEGSKCVKRPPDVMIAGVAKTGTMELGDFMTIHPQIVTKAKFYLLKDSHIFRASTIDDLPCAYDDQVSFAKAWGSYTYPDRPQELFDLNPNMKLIFMVREPISRTISALTFRPTHADRNVVENSKTLNKKLMSNNSHIEMSTYDTHFEKFLKLFKRESILVLENVEFTYHPNKVFKKIEDFLKTESFDSSKHFVVNPESNFYCIRNLVHNTQNMTCYERNRGRKIALEIEEDVKGKLKTYFKPHNENFFRMIGQRYDW